MIVIAPALVSSPPALEPLNYPTMGWHNVVSASTLVASSSDALYPVSNLANPATYLYWQGASATLTTIDIDVGGSLVDYVAIAGHNFGSAAISVTLQEGVGHTALMAVMSPVDNTPIIWRFVPGTKTTIRILLSAGTVAPKAAVVYVGKLTVFERGTQGGYTPLPHGLVNNVANGESESGNFLGRIVTGAHLESKASFKYLSPTWYRTYLAPYMKVSVKTPFFFAWEPVTWPAESGYAWLATDPVPVFDELGYAHIDMDMVGLA